MYKFSESFLKLQKEIGKLNEKYKVVINVAHRYQFFHKVPENNMIPVMINLISNNEKKMTDEDLEIILKSVMQNACIYLDDVRTSNNKYCSIKNYDSFVEFIERFGVPKFISFDHDLGEGKSGYDCAKFLVEYCMDHQLKLPKYAVHSQNPVGKENIEKLLENFKKFLHK